MKNPAMRLPTPRLCLWVALALTSCAPKYESGVTRCSPRGACPVGFLCSGGICYDAAGAVPDGGAADGGTVAGGDAARSVDAPAGPDGPPPDGAGPPPPPATCTEYAAAFCAKQVACEPLLGTFGVEADCRQTMDYYCKTFLADLPDGAWTPAAAGVCVAELKLPGCFGWFGLSASRKCDPRGKRPGGAGAFSWIQCESAASYWRTGQCGYCHAVAAAGQPCRDDAVCPPGHLCSQARRCRPASLNGQPCGNDSPCHPAFVCAGGVCAPPAKGGSLCKSDADCDASLGLLCHTALGRCGKGVPGASWNGGNTDGTVNTCAPGTTPQSTGACLPLAAEGAACVSSGDGALCRFPANCVAGRCVLPKVVDCPAVRPPEGYPPGKDPWCNLSPANPLYCPERGDLGWGCWPADTACNTVVLCGEEPRHCTAPNLAFDCTGNMCIQNPCTKPEKPTYCPARDNIPSGCGSPDARCSTAVNCNGDVYTCTREGTTPDCVVGTCVPACEAPPGATACNACAAQKCCASYGACQGDPMCSARAGANWSALQACATRFCAMECGTNPLLPPPPR
jgi:hypothetical protein